MRILLKILLLFLSLLSNSCNLFEEESIEEGICVFDEFIDIGDYIKYDCVDNVLETACDSNWYPNQSCEEFCDQKIIEGALCE